TLQRRTRDDRDTPCVMHRETDIDRARVAVTDEQPAREGELGEPISGGAEARLPTLEAARVVGHDADVGELGQPLRAFGVRHLTIAADRTPRVVSECDMVWRADVLKSLAHFQVSSNVACTARLSHVATCSSS